MDNSGDDVGTWSQLSILAATVRTSNEDDIVSRTSDWAGSYTDWRWDVFGQVTARVDPAGNVYRYRYDAAGNLTEIQLADGARIRLSYDPSGD
jgi:YD repeat-containing protein